MTVRPARRLGALAPGGARRVAFDLTDATREPDPGPPPEIVFDRVTGPATPRRVHAGPGAHSGEEDA